MCVSASRQVAKILGHHNINVHGLSKRYVRCLQISKVVNHMKDLIEFSHNNKLAPIDTTRPVWKSFLYHVYSKLEGPPQPQTQTGSSLDGVQGCWGIRIGRARGREGKGPGFHLGGTWCWK